MTHVSDGKALPPPHGADNRSGRLAIFDGLRGFAILAMIVYHLSWDLSWFAYVNWQVSSDASWRAFAASIAGSFLFLSGVSLSLANDGGIRWHSFWKREVVLVVAASAVSAITWFTFDQNFVRFGILHCLAAGSLLAVVFTRLPAFVTLVAAALAGLLPLLIDTPQLDGDLWLWTGLGTPDHGAVDYVPLSPWLGLILLGIGLTRLLRATDLWIRLADIKLQGIAGRLLIFLGQKSLIIYLVHQPMLYGAVWLIAATFGAPDRSVESFIGSCTANCADLYGDAKTCEAACRCTQTDLADAGRWQPLVQTPNDPALRGALNDAYEMCLRQHPPALTPLPE
ncbi:DUF1624 domain-containing protein [Roseibium sp. CAU 1637]|uniref:DUF1624 domain-containing protein n=1 Tax=Roseibium limicola TaxID=2816037 RepID=A0A939J577_9HYPH|nr:heparan-alpha-glucosaminide N-acetyltransferase [Roseibium limicola]MBO0343792.1 DUF1624 domain-containing protein [Roseibium limicola]